MDPSGSENDANLDNVDASIDVDDAPDIVDDAPLDPEQALIQELGQAFETDDADADDVDDEVSNNESGSQTDEVFTVKVDGEEIEVSLDELRDGYSRQADYTRKTQALAAERERLAGMEQLAAALNSDPAGTLRELAQALNVDLGGSQTDDPSGDDEFLDPLERQVRELQAQLEQVSGKLMTQEQLAAQAREDAALQAELDRIKRENNDPNLVEDDLLRFALDNKINDLDVAYKFMRLDVSEKVHGSAALDAKRQAPPIEGGGGRRNTRRGPAKIESIEDALQAALAEASNT